MSPRVSVIVPTYNRAALLPFALESVFSQSVQDFELIVADDGSTDATSALLAIAARDQRVVALPLVHSGNPARVRNAAIARARGEVLAFLDSDDAWMPRKLERQLAALDADPGHAWSYTGFTHVDAAGRVLDDGVARAWAPCEGAIFEATVTGAAPIRTASVVMTRRAVLLAAGGFDERLVSGQDYDLWMRIAYEHPVVVVREPLTAVRVHADSHSSMHPPRALEARDLSLRAMSVRADACWHPLLRRARRRNSTTLAASHLAAGDRVRMIVAMSRGLSFGWYDARWWAANLRTCLRSLRATLSA